MRQQRCKPDLAAYTHMITAHNKAGQWRTSLQLFEQMQQANCRPDALVYTLVVDVLWNTGIASAQAKAVQVSLYYFPAPTRGSRKGSSRGLLRAACSAAGPAQEDVSGWLRAPAISRRGIYGSHVACFLVPQYGHLLCKAWQQASGMCAWCHAAVLRQRGKQRDLLSLCCDGVQELQASQHLWVANTAFEHSKCCRRSSRQLRGWAFRT